ncbi:hypothetical protein B0H13DRAFT_2313689 [Mycena leptocephala]|nr:hypothetical protein B0H13DRAFT_2378796 [Mycena leptocephala]KAJ7926359.1 hypothetical protein B0H13DRAFT_2313689 [Mycena leptocephala]
MAAFSVTVPTLPRELEKIIFEMAALKHPLSMPSMVRVAQRVKIWIEPQLYKVLMIDIAPGRSTYAQCIVIRFLRTVQKLIASSSRRAPMLRKHVRHLILSSYCPKDFTLKLLSLGNSTAWAWWIYNVLHGTFTDPAFADITHLHIHGPDTWSYPSWSIFVYPLRLTHLSFTENCVRESTAEWERGARGFDDYWIEAEAIVAERRQHRMMSDIFLAGRFLGANLGDRFSSCVVWFLNLNSRH